MAGADDKLSLKQLKEYHDKYGGGSAGPAYNFVPADSGFMVECEYREFKTVGRGTSKVNAQREAAFKLLQRLPNRTTNLTNNIQCSGTSLSSRPVKKHNQEPLSLTSQQIEKIRSFIERHKATVDIYRKLKAEDEKSECPLNDVNVGLKGPLAPKSITLSSRTYCVMDAVEAFEEVMKEMNLQFYCEFPDIKSETGQLVAMLKINFNGLIFAGLDETLEGAVFRACKNGLQLLNILIK